MRIFWLVYLVIIVVVIGGIISYFHNRSEAAWEREPETTKQLALDLMSLKDRALLLEKGGSVLISGKMPGHHCMNDQVMAIRSPWQEQQCFAPRDLARKVDRIVKTSDQVYGNLLQQWAAQ